MKKTILAITAAASIFVLGACSSGDDEVVVSTKYGDITKEDFYQELKNSTQSQQVLAELLIAQVLENNYEVSDKEVEEEFKKQKEQFGDQYETYLATYGIDEKTFKKYVRLNLLQEKALDVDVTDEEIEKYYEQAKYEINARHILISDEKKAKEVLEKIKKGEDFEKLAKENSEDPGSAEDGGNLGWFTVGKMVPEFNDAAYALKKNEVSDLVKTSYGYHIIQLLDKREIKDYGTLEEKKEEITEAIKQQKVDPNEVLSKLVNEADVKVKDKDLEKVLDLFKEQEEGQE